jgi:hypothetical protein
MKKLVLVFGIMILAAQANAENMDGCYLLFEPNVAYPTICLQGTMEEGIGGAGARLTIFHTNSDKVIACVKSTSLVMTPDELRFQVDGKDEIILNKFDTTDGYLKGDAKIGNTQLKFGRWDAKTEKQLLKIANEKCQ